MHGSHQPSGCHQRPSPLGRLLALVALALVLAVLLPPGRVAAHPAGLLLNRWVRVHVEPDTTYVHYVLDFSEFATMLDTGSYQQIDGTVDDAGRVQYAADRARELRVGLHLRFNDVEVPLHIDSYYAEIRQVDAALPALRLEVMYSVATPPLPLTGSLVDDNWSFTLGWREMVVTAGQGALVAFSTAPSQDQSNVLRRYPDGYQIRFPSVTEASFEMRPGPVTPPTASSLAAPQLAPGWKLPQLLSAPSVAGPMDSVAIVLALLTALALGALHTAAPGHGKSMVAAYLLASGDSLGHLVLLGGTISIMHTLLVYIVGLAALVTSSYLLPGRLIPIIGLVCSVMVVGAGIRMVAGPLRRRGTAAVDGHQHDEHCGHGHTLPPAARPGLGGVVAMGVSGGMVPCQTALVMMLSAVAAQKVLLGLALTAAFSVGMAGLIVLFGVAILVGRRRLPAEGRLQPPAALLRFAGWMAPFATGVVVTGVGLLLLLQSIVQMVS